MWGGSLGIFLVGALGCWQGRAEDAISEEPHAVETGSPEENGEAPDSELHETPRIEPPGNPIAFGQYAETVEGEAFSQIWGTSDDLWVLGGPVPGEAVPSRPMAAILRCPLRFDADVVIRRNVGDGWRDMAVPAETALTSLHGSDANNVWAVGLGAAAVQFDGEAWIEHDLLGADGLEFQAVEGMCFELSLHSVFARSASDVWAVGYIYPSSLGPGLILHYDGSSWRRHPTGAPDGFFGVWAASESDAWAVGSSGLAYHFDGVSWSPADAKTSQYLFSVWGTSAADVWATGNAAVSTRFDGSGWQLVQSELTDSVSRSLAGNAAAGLWSLVDTSAGDGSRQHVFMRNVDGVWREEIVFAEAGNAFGDLWVTPDGQVWTVGTSIVRLR